MMIPRLARLPLIASALAALSTLCSAQPAPPPTRPNIVYILCDDLGYGDVSSLNPTRGKIPTPHIDRLAAQGLTFTDAHSPSSVCTPTRYGILTGRYAWRTRLQSGVLQGDGKPLIAPDRLTVPAFLKQHGYTTAAFGKWHLGLTFGPDRFTTPIADGPLQHGFDRFFGISASLDMPPFAFIDQDRFPEPATVTKKWGRTGPAAPSFEAVDVVPTLTRKAADYIASRAADAKAGKPFFLYLALTSPHTPIVPSKQWQGKSPIGPYGDFVIQTDHAAGQVLDALDRAGLADDTLVVFTSDNGFSPHAGVKAIEAAGHYPSAHFRGYKADIWDGGHRIPLIARWPGHIKPASTSAQLVCLTDLLATCADLTGVKLPDDAGEDSVSLLPALLGTDTHPLRQAVVHHSINGNFSLRQGNWKLELAHGSGGWAAPREYEAKTQGLPPVQLYDMTADPSETNNVAAANPEVVQRLTTLLHHYVNQGRSTPGLPQKNDAPIELNKPPKPATRATATTPSEG